MKRIGILSLFYKTYNFGAQLQAYALQRVIQSLGYECEQIRFVWSCEQTRLGYENASIDPAAFEAFAQQIPHSARVYTPENLEKANQEYDGFVCGSDQIWGVRNSMPLHVLPQMALSFAGEEKKRIAYGASFGSADISEDRKEVLSCFLNRLESISVREKSAIPVLEKLTDKAVQAVVDPVMLLSAKEWSLVAGKGGGRHPKGRYVLLYHVSCSQRLYDSALNFAQENGMDLIQLSYKEGALIGPCDFISYMEHADYVITDSFHGTVLSILFHKPFIVFGVDRISTKYSRNVRVKDMLEICGLGDRFFLEVESGWRDSLKQPIHYRNVDRRIETAAVCSVEYLKKALGSGPTEKKKRKVSQQLYDKVVRQGRCTGCTACTRCSVSSVKMEQNELGFYQPRFDHKSCVDCGQCLKLCPVFSFEKSGGLERPPLSTYTLRAKDEILLEKSSSGGAFPVFAKRILEEDGIVYGAAYDKQNSFAVGHICIQTEKELAVLQKSKYVQSDLKDCFFRTEEQLKGGKTVLFTGTPCQIAGLKAYLHKDYEKLYTVDLICGGVTAPLLWKKYAEFYGGRFPTDLFDMRSKSQGFFKENGKLAFSISHIRNGEEHFFEKETDLFLSTRMSFYNESCYHCKFKGNCHAADLTIGDCVGFPLIAPGQSDNRGVSLVLVRSRKGRALLEECRKDFTFYSCSQEAALAQNEMIGSSMRKPLGTDFLRGIAPVSTIERIYYETKQVQLFQEKEALFGQLFLEMKRNELLLKLKRYAALECKAEYDPLVEGGVVIYGAGKLGRALLDCLKEEPLCFLDRSKEIHNLCGYPVYRMRDREFQDLYEQKRLTVLVTPVWDFWEIREQLKGECPNVNVVSVDRLVENIWV